MISKSCFHLNSILLIYCLLGTSQAQEQSSFVLEKLASSLSSPFKSIIFHPQSGARAPQPKIIVKWKSIDFLAENGTIKKQFNSNSDIFVKLSSNGEYLGVQHGQLHAHEMGSVKDAEFALLNSEGELLWKEPYKTYWDEPSDVYDVSSLGTVSKIIWYKGTVTFYDKSGTNIADHLILPGANKGIFAKWSPDGHFFTATSRDPAVRETYQSQVLMFDKHGKKLWTDTLANSESSSPVFSPRGQWVWLRARKMLPTGYSRGIIYETLTGKAIVTLEEDGLIYVKFSQDETLMLGQLNIRNISHLALYEAPSGKKIFHHNTQGRLLDYAFLPEKNLICFLVNNKIRSPRKPPVSNSPEAVREALMMKDVRIGFLDFHGNLVSLTSLPDMQVLPGNVSVRLNPGANFLSILTGNEVMNFKIHENAH